MTSARSEAAQPGTSRRILTLALPALGALIAQPIFVATDTAMVGHLGETVLAGLAIGSACITTVVGLMVFLAYTTTPVVARHLGAGNKPAAIRAGFDGMWLALYCAIGLLLVGLVAAAPVIGTMTDDPFVESAALSYLTISLWGLPGMLVSLAAIGLLRGLQDTRTPLIVSVAGAICNIGFNYIFIYGLQLGIAGSALGTAVVETLMAVVYVTIAVRAASREDVPLSPGIGDPRAQLHASGFMLLRTATLRIALVAMVWAAGQVGTTELAALQVGMTVFNLLAFALDALAIAAQAMIGHDLAARPKREVYRLAIVLSAWGIGFGVLLYVVLSLTNGLVGYTWLPGGLASLFTADATVVNVANSLLMAMALTMPIAGLVFALDGVLIGAADNAYLALSGVLNLIVFGVALWFVMQTSDSNWVQLIGIWMAFGGAMMLSRAVTLVARLISERWMHTAVIAAAPATDTNRHAAPHAAPAADMAAPRG